MSGSPPIRPTSESRGAVFVATGAPYRAEASSAIASLKLQMPDLPVTLYSDDEAIVAGAERQFLIADPAHSFLDKIDPLRSTPYDRTLFLDTDVYVCAPLDDVFELLDRFEIAFCHAPRRFSRINGRPNELYPLAAVPEAFVEPNSGVIAFRRTPALLHLLGRWRELYLEQLASPVKPGTDQPALRQALYESGVAMHVLPPEYNFRTTFPQTAGMTVKILHGRTAQPEVTARMLNEDPLDLRWLIPGEPIGSWTKHATRQAAPQMPPVLVGPASELGFAQAVLAGHEYATIAPASYDPEVVVDVGAHIGGATLLFRKLYPRARIFAFEPAPASFGDLERNTKQIDNVFRLNYGLSDHTAVVPLYLGERWAAGNSTYYHGNSSTNSVEIRIEEAGAVFCRQGITRIGVLKVDTEGHEIAILGSLQPWLATTDIIYLEYHCEEARRQLDQMLGEWFYLYGGKISWPNRGVLTFANRRFVERYGLKVGPPIPA
jgi:FkbM family methyltransferase